MSLKDELNYYGSRLEPILFVINFDMSKWYIHKLKDLPKNIKYSINKTTKNTKPITLSRKFIDFATYKNMIKNIKKRIKNGDIYLLNLTFSTDITTNATLEHIYDNANAKFKLLYKNKFVSFSPERFIRIDKNKIYTYPMKGTIDKNIPKAKEKIINDTKEKAEHIMTVDLLRNDLSIVAKNVTVEKLRYIDEIKTDNKTLLQVSSKISGELKKDWQKSLGDIITSLLPAGSITGTPKKKAVEIIKKIELHDRDFFTGIFGVFDGKSVDSAVLIRFIENQNGSLVYKSGGGITYLSEIQSEYSEMKDKVYVPIF